MRRRYCDDRCRDLGDAYAYAAEQAAQLLEIERARQAVAQGGRIDVRLAPASTGTDGVVVGALLGGLAQIVVGSLAEGRRRRQWRKEQQAEAYRHLLTRFYEATRRWERHETDDPVPSVESVRELMDDTAPLAGISLFGSRAASKASEELVLALVRYRPDRTVAQAGTIDTVYGVGAGRGRKPPG